LSPGALPPIPLATLRAAVEGAGAPPRRRHGQHFLQDANLLGAIVRDAGVAASDVVLEIGPGPGLLTRHLLATGAAVRAVEIDPRVRTAAERLVEAPLWERLRWVEGDALDGPRALSAVLRGQLEGCTRVVSNLPYNVAAPLIVLLLEEPASPEHLVLLIQAEMAERLLAEPGGRDYGGLSVVRALCADARVLRRVPPSAFWPPPKVDSVVIELRRRADRPSAEALGELQTFLGLAFQARRKTLPNSVSQASGVPVAEVCRRLGLEEKVRKLRAEAFSPVQFAALARDWASYAESGRKRS
jgi:16S rRNA (adenine1518-N6/adenine1519-N6)-dimethyltransferase